MVGLKRCLAQQLSLAGSISLKWCSTRVPRVVSGVAPETSGGWSLNSPGAGDSERPSALPIRRDAELDPRDAGATPAFLIGLWYPFVLRK